MEDAGLGLAIWDVEYKKEGADWVLRVIIDKTDPEQGVSIDDCVAVTHLADPLLDEADPIPQEYLLEVSSPGIGRRLSRPAHFQAFLGAPLRVKLHKPLEDGRKVLEGVLLSAEEDGSFTLQLDEDTAATFEKAECAQVNLIEEI